jgi:UDP-N-acetylglucosamine--N-acetylmuramyl-(pentapeptide) pyrophosphoryl-undecaprenol N-acetylglucosamine transferase
MAYQTFPFYREMQDLYQRSDMAITRAGANTLFELALFGIPAIVIPYPHAGAHQKENAMAFAEEGALVFKTEGELIPDWLAGEIRSFLNDSAKREPLGKNIRRFSSDGAEKRLVEIAGELMGEKACGPYAKI